ncbi:hypothetical protein AMTR_s00072p00102490 [Amborella trichopoda]|uniref:Uncharacterized protein n=1 Tax=Amborella trichopoda TaxID=13333 RepID=W1NRD3_AMBTC|nr:hypothetical protein AMTR_s00072p00102490 [Amborella trichopoda]
MTGGRAPHISISAASRPSHRGKAPMEEGSESRGPGVSGSVQGESSHRPTRVAVRALAESSVRSSGDPEGVECDSPKLDDVDMDAVPPPTLLSDEEWREQERERIRDTHEWAMIEDEPKVIRQEVDLTIDHGPLSDEGWIILSKWPGVRRLWAGYTIIFVVSPRGPAIRGIVQFFSRFGSGNISLFLTHFQVDQHCHFRLFIADRLDSYESRPYPISLCCVFSDFQDNDPFDYMFLVMPYFSGQITPPWTPIMISTADEDVYMREMTPWMEEWRDRIAHVIGEVEEGSISLSLYEEKYKVVLRDVAALTNHGEGMMRQLWTAYLGRNQFSGVEVASLHADRDSAIEERDSIAEDLESLHHDFEGMREVKDMAEMERDTIRDELERDPARDGCHELLEDVKGLIDKSGKLLRLLLAMGGNPSLADANPYMRVLLPSSTRNQSQSQASTRMTRS